MKNTVKLFMLTIFSLCTFISWGQKEPVIMSVNEKDVTKSEFLQVYLKNNNDPKFDKATLDEYMVLFKNFKLKVAEAERLGYDTLPHIVTELKGYKEQLARPYLVDSSKNTDLVREAYERMKHEVSASHILVRVGEKAAPEDTLKAYNKIMALKKRIEKGEDFASVAMGKDGSEDPSVVDNQGKLGYFTAFQMVYPFESVAYNTAVGEVGGPIRTSYGYHLVKVHDKRATRGTITAAHIMVGARRDADPEDLKNAEKKIKEIYEKLNDGEDFSKLARLYSDDRGTKQNGGKLPTFGAGTNQRMLPEFEDVAFSLENDLEYSAPFQTDYGFHIIRRIDFSPLGSFEELEKSITSKVNRGDRGQSSQASFIANLKSENNFVDKSAKGIEWFNENVDSTIFRGKWNAPKLKKNRVLFEYAGNKYMSSNFLDYILESQKPAKRISIPIHVAEFYKKWVNKVILDHEKMHLEEKHPEFRALLSEYHDGVLLYEIMKDKVWDKALSDTAELKLFHEKNKTKYVWDDRIHANVFSSNDAEKANQAMALIQEKDTLPAKKIVSRINRESQLNLSLKTDKFSINETPYLKETQWKDGALKLVEDDGMYHIVQVIEVLPSREKTFQEARGAVIQDYQNHLEETWLEELRERHIITVHNEVLYSLGK